MTTLDSENLIIIKEEYFTRMNVFHHLHNKGENRPHFLSLRDPEYPEIFWIVPCTTDNRNKHHDRVAKYPNRSVSNYTQFVRVLGIEQTLLFEKSLPIRESDIRGIKKNKNGIKFTIDNPAKLDEFKKIALDIIPKLKRGTKFSRFQPDQEKIFNKLKEEIDKEKEISLKITSWNAY